MSFIVEVKQGEQVIVSAEYNNLTVACFGFLEAAREHTEGDSAIVSALLIRLLGDRFSERISYHNEPFTAYGPENEVVTLRLKGTT